MSNLANLCRRLAYLFRRDEFTQDLQEEMRLHVELRARKFEQQGIAGKEAQYMAQRSFGNLTVAQDASSALWGWTAWERLFQDFRLGVRTLSKTPGFTAIAVLTLALGLGINTAVFSVVNAVMIRSLPYPDAGRLFSLWEEVRGPEPGDFSSHGSQVGAAGTARRTTVSVLNLWDYQRQGQPFAQMAGYDLSPKNLTGIGNPERIQGESVTANYFPVMGVAPVQGRAFVADDDRPGASPVVIISYGFWQRRLGGDTAVLERTIRLDGRAYQVIGVLPPEFRSPTQLALALDMEFYVPAAYSGDYVSTRGNHDINVVGRLEPGVTLAAAQSGLKLVSAGLAAQYPQTNRNISVALGSLHDDLVRSVKDSLFALLGASGLIVLITCVNVANLLLVRAIARRHESSVRLALGASRFRMVRQFLAESLLIAAGGCLAGILLGLAIMRVLVAMAPASIPEIRSVSMDWRVFAVCTAIATVTGLIFGVAPAWQASQTKPVEALKTTSRSTGGKSQVRWRTALMVAEVALSVILTVGAGLLLKSFVVLMGVNLGFQPDRVLAMNINLPDAHYAGHLQRLQFFDLLEQRVRALPGVQSAAFSNRMPMRGGWRSSIMLDDAAQSSVEPDFQAVSPEYFATLGIPLLRGRLLTEDDRLGNPYVAVVNQAYARKYLQGGDPVGRRFRYVRNSWVTLIGMVADIRRGGKEAAIQPEVYLSAAQSDLYPVRLADFAVRASVEPHQLINAIQSQVWAIDKDQPITNVRTMEEIISNSVAQRRFQTALLLLFAGVAVGLSVIGIFGVLSYSVNQRTSELGLRLALGAQPVGILALVLKQAGALIGAGVVAGLAGAYVLTRYIQSLLFNVERNDWGTYAASVGLLAAVAVAAALIPARRGSRVDPIVALRYE